MKQVNQEKRFFLEVMRTGYTGGASKEGEICYIARCERCGEKVRLVSREQSKLQNSVSEALHAQLIFAGKLLACPNY